MKFGDTLPRRSVPKWAAYNVNYNQLKHLIKIRTSRGSALPVSIPSVGVSRWHDLDTELYRIIAIEYANIALFLRSKQGEIERRLAHLEKQVASTEKAVKQEVLDRPILQARKYQKLVRDADSVGDEIENLSRFAGVQKTAFRKILKKYRKWTDSTGLQQRLDNEVFSSGALQVDYANYLHRLAAQSNIISSRLAGPMLSGSRLGISNQSNGADDGIVNRSNAGLIASTCSKNPLQFDVALSSVPYGEAGGSAYFWIHPDNLEEAEALLLRHMRRLEPSSPSASEFSPNNLSPGSRRRYHVVYHDNLQRFTQVPSLSKPSRVALTARWRDDPEGLVTFSSLAPRSNVTDTVKIRRKELGKLLQHSSEVAGGSAEAKLRDYLSEHRDVKPLAEIHSCRTRYVGLKNASEVGSWSTLDSSVLIAPANPGCIGDVGSEAEAAEAFPHSILYVRWEFSRLPEIVRVFQTSHLAELVSDFSLENAAIYTVFKDLDQPDWQKRLQTDIRKVPAAIRRSGTTRRRSGDMSAVPVTSGPSSTEGPSDSVFSAAAERSSVTSIEASPTIPQGENSIGQADSRLKKKKKRYIRIALPQPQEPPSQRYWNEFDDGESDVNPEESYAIYVDPNGPSFPGAESVSRMFGTMYDSLNRGSKQMIAWFPIKSRSEARLVGERAPLLTGASPVSPDPESSGSDTDELAIPPHKDYRRKSVRFRPGQQLSRRQKAVESALFQFYTGLIMLAYLLLLMAAILFTSGRKKKVLEVDAGVIAGVVAAEACAGTSMVLICMRRKPVGPVHWGLVVVNVIAILMIGIAELTIMFLGRG